MSTIFTDPIPNLKPAIPTGDGVTESGGGPGEEVNVNPKWSPKTCADLQASSNVEISSSHPSEVLFAVLRKASLLWDVGQVGFNCAICLSLVLIFFNPRKSGTLSIKVNSKETKFNKRKSPIRSSSGSVTPM